MMPSTSRKLPSRWQKIENPWVATDLRLVPKKTPTPSMKWQTSETNQNSPRMSSRSLYITSSCTTVPGTMDTWIDKDLLFQIITVQKNDTTSEEKRHRRSFTVSLPNVFIGYQGCMERER
mmetsp:Transcript_23738/g.49405  ORF Transcript_23738/g.49405 Transcript_23738/m.49405 type:complete len:120 (+) Transcript_23738:206-565(+)